jgi:uncharacterized protein YcbX
MSAAVTQLQLAPVKGMQVATVDALDVGALGAEGDRAFFVVDPEHAMVETARATGLLGVLPHWDGSVLTLRFPDGTSVAEEVVPGAAATTRNYDGRAIAGRLVDGELAAAVSAHLGRPVRLLARDADAMGPGDQPLSLVSEATVAALAPALGGAVPDARRFRMNVTIGGVEPWQEHAWAGRELAVGGARVRGVEPVPRCVVTTLDPASGRRDVPVLKALVELRGKAGVHLGLWCEVTSPGRIALGDPVAPA